MNGLVRSEITGLCRTADSLRKGRSQYLNCVGQIFSVVFTEMCIRDRVRDHPEWYLYEQEGSLRSPRAIDPADARNVTVWGDLAEINYHDPAHHDGLISYFGEMMGHFIDCGIRGFRCDAAYLVPPEVWSRLIFSARSKRNDAIFFAETLGCRLEQISSLRSAGFDYLFNSARWWDFRSPWLLEQYNSFRHIAPSIAFPESHDTERVATELERMGCTCLLYTSRCV